MPQTIHAKRKTAVRLYKQAIAMWERVPEHFVQDTNHVLIDKANKKIANLRKMVSFTNIKLDRSGIGII